MRKPPKSYVSPPEENLPPNSILTNIKMSPKLKPPPHLLRMFSTYLKEEDENPSMAAEIDFDDFGKNWLALFNYGAHKDQTQIPIMKWVEQVAKNPYRPVKLMRWIDGKYTCVALIPPIFDNQAPLIKNDDRDYFMQMATKQAHLVGSASKPDQANGYIERNITSRLMGRQPNLSRHFHQMNAIFEMYGVQREIPDWLLKETGGLSPKTEEVVKVETQQSNYSDGMILDDDY